MLDSSPPPPPLLPAIRSWRAAVKLWLLAIILYFTNFGQKGRRLPISNKLKSIKRSCCSNSQLFYFQKRGGRQIYISFRKELCQTERVEELQIWKINYRMEDLTGSSLPRYLLIETFPNVKWFIIFHREEIHPLEVFNIKLSPMGFNLLNYSVVKSFEFCRHILFENTFSVQAWNVKFCDWICSSKTRIAVWFRDNIEGKIAKCIKSLWWSNSLN